MEGGRRAVLAVAHPGHELLVHGWLRRTVPRVLVLTDGSGRAGRPRIDRTTALLRRAGVAGGGLYGRHADAAIYAWILDGRTDAFVALARELAKDLTAENVDLVVGDAAEGYNPIHDAFRLTLDAAIALARREREVESYDFALFEPPGPRHGEARVIELTAAEREAKHREAAGYAELEREVEWSLERHGRAAFDREWLRPVHARPGEYAISEIPPVYERYGDHLARTGALERVIRLEEHMLPIAEALGAAAGS